jgi:hypothetical protein
MATAVSFAGTVVIPQGFSAENRYFNTQNTFKYNALLAMREGHANARAFRKKKGEPYAHFAVIMLEDTKEGYQMYAHNGEPFQDAKEIAEKGLRPYASERRGGGLNGTGLTCYAATCGEGEVMVLSNTVKEGWKTAKAFFNQDRLEVEITIEDEFNARLPEIFGEEFLKTVSVIYLWKTPYEPKPVGKDERWSLSDAMRNSLSYMAGDEWFKEIPLIVSKTICRLHDPKVSPTGDNFHRWLTHRVKDGKVVKGKPGHNWRTVPGIDELQKRNAIKKWTFESDPFVVETNNSKDTLKATVTIIAHPGKIPDTETNDSGFLRNCRNSPEGYHTSWKEGEAHEACVIPDFNLFVYAPLFAKPTDADEKIRLSFSRFEDNAVHMGRQIAWLLGLQDLFYDGDKDSTRNTVRAGYKPYVILQINFTDLLQRERKLTGEIIERPSKNEYMTALGRSPLFVLQMPDSQRDAILRKAMESITIPTDHECREWFEENFQRPALDRLIFDDESGNGHTPKNPRYQVFDLQNEAGDFEWDRELYTGTKRLVAVRDIPTGRFAATLETSAKNPRCEGFLVQPLTDATLAFRPDVLEYYDRFRTKFGISDDITIFEITVQKMGLYNPATKRVDTFTGTPAEIAEQYLESSAISAERDYLIPTRGFHAKVEEFGVVERLARVMDIPQNKRVTPPGPRPDPTTKPHRRSAVQRYCVRDARVPVQVVRDTVQLNERYPLIAETCIGMRNEETPRKLGQRLYNIIKTLSLGIRDTFKQGTGSFETPMNESQWLDDKGESIFMNSEDFAINFALIQILPNLDEVKDLREKLNEIKMSYARA